MSMNLKVLIKFLAALGLGFVFIAIEPFIPSYVPDEGVAIMFLIGLAFLIGSALNELK